MNESTKYTIGVQTLKVENFLKPSRLVILVLSLTLAFHDIAFARGGPSLIRDSELENDMRIIAVPIFEAAGLNSKSVHTYIVNDKSINAFVAGGQNVFVNSGLILAVRNVNELIGVIAHETGHISGGHLARFQEGMKGASAIAILGMVLGAAAMATGAGDAGAAIALGSQQAATRSILAYSRDQESAADQAGLKFMTKTHQSGRGLVSFLSYLGDQTALIARNQDPYAQSHPISSERVAALRTKVEESPYADAKEPEKYVRLFKRMQAKLAGYLNPPYVTFQKYPPEDNSMEARYARAYAYDKEHNMDKAMAEADSLIRDYPDDPYFRELKGFLLFEDGKIRQSIPPYRKAVELKGDEPLILTALGQALVATEDPKLNSEAITVLKAANRYEDDNPFTWRQLATAYYRAGDEGMTHLATAESFLLSGDVQASMLHANQALEKLKTGTPGWLRAQDILYIARSNMSEKARKRMPAPPDQAPDQGPEQGPQKQPDGGNTPQQDGDG